MSFEIYYTEWVVDLKAISRVLLLQSSNLWVSAATVVGKSIFLPLINRSLVLHSSPLSPPCPISPTISLGFHSFCGHGPVSIIQGKAGLKWKESANRADVD